MLTVLQETDLCLNDRQFRVNLRPRFSQVFSHLSLFNFYTYIHSGICAPRSWFILKEKQASLLFLSWTQMIQYWNQMSCHGKSLQRCVLFYILGNVFIWLQFRPDQMNLFSDFDTRCCPYSSFSEIYPWNTDIYKNLTWLMLVLLRHYPQLPRACFVMLHNLRPVLFFDMFKFDVTPRFLRLQLLSITHTKIVNNNTNKNIWVHGTCSSVHAVGTRALTAQHLKIWSCLFVHNWLLTLTLRWESPFLLLVLPFFFFPPLNLQTCKILENWTQSFFSCFSSCLSFFYSFQ